MTPDFKLGIYPFVYFVISSGTKTVSTLLVIMMTMLISTVQTLSPTATINARPTIKAMSVHGTMI